MLNQREEPSGPVVLTGVRGGSGLPCTNKDARTKESPRESRVACHDA